MTYLLQRFVVDKAGSIFGNFKLTLLDLLAELPAHTPCELALQCDNMRWAQRIGQRYEPGYDAVSNSTKAGGKTYMLRLGALGCRE
jgi:hypothetical protein